MLKEVYSVNKDENIYSAQNLIKVCILNELHLKTTVLTQACRIYIWQSNRAWNQDVVIVLYFLQDFYFCENIGET